MDRPEDHQLIILQQNCFACGDFLDTNKRSVLDSTQFSDQPIYKFIGKYLPK